VDAGREIHRESGIVTPGWKVDRDDREHCLDEVGVSGITAHLL